MTHKTKEVESTDFASLGLNQQILTVLHKQNIRTPSPIQHQAIPPILQGKDVIGIAQTGTGKTFAFGLPLLQQLAQSNKRALIVAPTRELAYQIEQSLSACAQALRIRTTVFVGGVPMRKQLQAIKQNPRVLIATPGRLNDHLEQGTITLKEVGVFVLDEADRMLDMGFKPQINVILRHVPQKRQTLLFSATMPKEILRLAEQEMQTPLRIEVAPEGTTARKIEQELIVVKREQKTELLLELLRNYQGSALVFTRTKHGAKKLNRVLQQNGLASAEIHGNRTLGQRKHALAGFKNGQFRILVATDIAARGIDVDDIQTVYNYDLPDDAADYVHRIGRTGRAGKTGKAVSFATPNQAKDVRSIERLIRASIPRTKVHSLPSLSLDDDKGVNGRNRRQKSFKRRRTKSDRKPKRR